MVTTNPNNNRPPLSLTLTHSNNPIHNPNPITRPKSKPVSSRYLLSPSISSSSSSSSASSSLSTPHRRSPSPIFPRIQSPEPKSRSISVTQTPGLKSRSVSADRRRTNDNAGFTSINSNKFTATRSLSVSFQGEAFSLPVKKPVVVVPIPTPSPSPVVVTRRRPGTPVAVTETVKKPDQLRWPARIRVNANSGNALLKSFDSCSLDKDETETEKTNNVGGSVTNCSSEILKSMRRCCNETDSDSVSSGSSNSGRTVSSSSARSAKFWDLPKCPSKIVVPPKFGQPKKFPSDNTAPQSQSPSPRAVSSPMRGLVRTSSPMRGYARPLSPNRVKNGSSDKGTGSPSRVRSSFSETMTPSVLSYAVDVKRGKVGEGRINDAHMLRLLYNRQLQWRFINARQETVLVAQRRSVQRNLLDAWETISKLRVSVSRKTHRLHLMKQKLKLASILKEQTTYLEDWASLDKGHCTSLLGSIEALKGSTLRLPVVDGAITDLQSMKDAIGSAVDVMQAMGSSICSLLLKVEQMSSVASELTKEVSKEQKLLEQCKVHFTELASQQVKYCSLRTHIVQDNRSYRKPNSLC